MMELMINIRNFINDRLFSLLDLNLARISLNRRKCSVKKIGAKLKLSYSKQSIPSKTYVQKLILRCSNKRKIVKVKNQRSMPNSIIRFIKFNKERTIKKKGLEASYKTAHKIEEKFGKKYSSSVIRKYRFKLGFRLRRIRKCPKQNDLQKLQRLIWCQRNRDCDFKDYIFVDETTIVVYDQPIYHLRLPSSRPEAIPSSYKFECKIHVWGGISYNGATEFASIKMPVLYKPFKKVLNTGSNLTLGKMQTFNAFLLIALVTICLISFLSASAIPESIDQTGLELAGLFNKECEKFSQEILWCTMEIVNIFFSNKFISLALNLILTIIDLSEFSVRI
ncbi:hypothetical protein BpHYR1_016415 [Brachionus plicatilis]|uniref:Transposase Tc1-like domain-containing protein n=1 Tax=Brachionus plicatilis TaxID=10195 RepID=A0A3M7T210_BRAPC|nr:hypothetical protein BpHYR1_016415 [Brachionus plicatilis]